MGDTSPALGSFRSRLADLASEYERLEADHSALLAEYRELKASAAVAVCNASDAAVPRLTTQAPMLDQVRPEEHAIVARPDGPAAVDQHREQIITCQPCCQDMQAPCIAEVVPETNATEAGTTTSLHQRALSLNCCPLVIESESSGKSVASLADPASPTSPSQATPSQARQKTDPSEATSEMGCRSRDFGEPSDGEGGHCASSECDSLQQNSVNSEKSHVSYISGKRSSRSRQKSVLSSPDGVIHQALNFMPSYFSADRSARRESTLSALSTPSRSFQNTGSASMQCMISRMGTLRMLEDEETLPAEPGVLSPVGLPRLYWDALSCMCLTLELWTTPFELVFLSDQENMPATLTMIMNFITAFFIADILLNFTTGYIRGSKTVMQRRDIVRNYLRCWFWLDLASAFPLDVLLANYASMNSLIRLAKAPSVFRKLRYLRMLRALRLMRMKDKARGILRDNSEELGPIMRYIVHLLLVLALLVLLAHLHACVWAALQEEVAAQTLSEALRFYFRSLWWAYMAFAAGSNAAEDAAERPAFWLLEMLVATERLLLGSILVMWCIFQVMAHCQDIARHMQLKEDALKYLKCHGVSFKTQLQVLYRTQEVVSALNVKRHFHEFASDLPEELRRKICEEMWASRLLSLGLIVHMASWHESFIQELALIVREETLASKSIVFTEGDTSIAAYCVLYGQIAIISTLTSVFIPDFVKGTWLGEKALVNPELHRSATAVTRVISSLLAVPADGFQQLLTHMDLEQRFSQFCEEHLWKGLCGRCGVLGDHFTDQCAMRNRQRNRTSSFSLLERQSRFASHLIPRPSLLKTASVAPLATDQSRQSGSSTMEWLTGWVRRSSWPLKVSRDTIGSYDAAIGKDLKEYLRECKLERIIPSLQRMGISSTKDLEAADLDCLTNDLNAQIDESSGKAGLSEEEKRLLSKESVQRFRKRLIGGVSKYLSAQNTMRNQHFLFLSHYKLEAGTEAALMRSELEQLMSEDPQNSGKHFEVPVFLDSENLNDLDNLQERVRKSHNIALLLTQGVLERPWVLVEMITATRARCQVLPVEVFKPGSRFQYPDEAFYKDLTDGNILDNAGMQVLADCGIELPELESALRKVFKRIAVPYSPHRPATIRQAELKALLSNCRVKHAEVLRTDRSNSS